MKREILSILVMFAVVFVVAGNVNAEGDGVSNGPGYYGGDTPKGQGDCTRACDQSEDCEPTQTRTKTQTGVTED